MVFKTRNCAKMSIKLTGMLFINLTIIQILMMKFSVVKENKTIEIIRDDRIKTTTGMVTLVFTRKRNKIMNMLKLLLNISEVILISKINFIISKGILSSLMIIFTVRSNYMKIHYMIMITKVKLQVLVICLALLLL